MKKFIIDHIDPLGQGVFKENDQIYFIPKTLPGESGHFRIVKSQKGVHFGEMTSLTNESPKRVDSTCPHFNSCSGCQFLHTDYPSELEFKKKSFQKLLKNLSSEMLSRGIELDHDDIETISSDKRLQYRNRIQLHYNLKTKLIGFKKSKSNQIIPVPECSIMEPEVQSIYQALILNWQKEAKKHKKTWGHVEIYKTETGTTVTWNKAYASGGFTQVNQPVNAKLQNYIKNLHNERHSIILDLFGGKGNLSKNLDFSKRLCVDLYPDEKSENKKEFLSLDLFKDDALTNFKKSNNDNFDCFIIDPPRSGFKQIDSWVESYMPKSIIYVSCNPATMIRDLKSLTSGYKVSKTVMIDLFPSTYHYEAMVLLEKA